VEFLGVLRCFEVFCCFLSVLGVLGVLGILGLFQVSFGYVLCYSN